MAYAADGLTVNWFDRHPEKLPVWWGANSKGALLSTNLN
jgi:hypothetical protein